jgi:hypothetical protein
MYKKQQIVKCINDLSDMDDKKRKKLWAFIGFIITMYALRQLEVKLVVIGKYLLSFSYLEMLMLLTVLGSFGILIMYFVKNYNKISSYISNRFSR